MSNIKLVHSGGNSVSLTTPTSNPGSNVTFKLPGADGSAGQVLQTDGNGNLTFVNLPSPGGITVAEQFRITSGVNIGNSFTTITANWAKSNSNAQGGIGSFADPSSGIFTFPSTGVYLVRFNGQFEETGASAQAGLRIHATENNNTYGVVSSAYGMAADVGTYNYINVTVETLVDVTDVTQVKVYFDAKASGTANLDGSSAQNRTYATFIRLGET